MSAQRILEGLGANVSCNELGGLEVTSPATGEVVATIKLDTQASLREKITDSVLAQRAWGEVPYNAREEFLIYLAEQIKFHREALANIVNLEAPKTHKDAWVEPDGSVWVLNKTIGDAKFAPAGNMDLRVQHKPAGVVGLITAFNYPLLVASWNLAPALLAGNSVVWKPSEKTPLTALGYEGLFRKAANDFNNIKGQKIVPDNLIQVVVGDRDIGTALVANESVDMVSATGSVAMGKGIDATLRLKKNRDVPSVLELGGNNAIVISNKCSPEHIEFALSSILNSMLVTGGQRCTNTRRVIVHEDVYDIVIQGLKTKFAGFIESGEVTSMDRGESGPYDYSPLIDEDAFLRMQQAVDQAKSEGGSVLFGVRQLHNKHPKAFYVQPALVELPEQSAVMFRETFAPILFVTKYRGDVDQAIDMVNAPSNARLVNGIYTLCQQEADRFASKNLAGHTVINSPKGTGGTPVLGLGFGGNGDSGQGTILESRNPLGPFTRKELSSRVAQNNEVKMNWKG